MEKVFSGYGRRVLCGEGMICGVSVTNLETPIHRCSFAIVSSMLHSLIGTVQGLD